MRELVCVLTIFISLSTAHAPEVLGQNLPIFDPINWGLTKIIKRFDDASEVLRNVILPFKRNISEVQTFFQEAKETVNVVVKNLTLAKDLIELLPKLERNFLASIAFVNNSEELNPKWKYLYPLGQLWYRSREALEVFKLAYDRDKGIMNDEQRIRLIDETYHRLRKINRAFQTSNRRHIKAALTINRAKQQADFFEALFSYN